jgi:glycosyltransferase involved in cell wall biosynthesis
MHILSKLTVIIPAYNEANSLQLLLPELIDHCKLKKWEIIIINDGSTDGTKNVLQKYSGTEYLTIISHKLNRGYGAAIKSGIIASNTEYIVTIDADGQHRFEDIDKLLHCITLKDADLVVGSRKGLKSSSYYKGIGKGFIRLLAKILMTVPVHDLNSGMKIYRAELAKKYFNLAPDTMAFSDIITLVFINNRHLVLEEPIKITERKHGKSSIGIETAFQTIMEIINIMILFSPMKIFLPLSLLCFLVTGVWGIPLALKGNGVSTGTLLGIITGILLFLLGLIAEQLSWIRRNQRGNH